MQNKTGSKWIIMELKRPPTRLDICKDELKCLGGDGDVDTNMVTCLYSLESCMQ